MDLLCSIYSVAVETDHHVFLSYSFAKCCQHHLGILIPTASSGSVFEWFTAQMNSISSDTIQMVCMVLWGLWRNRNATLWKNKWQTTVRLVNMVSSFLFQWQSTQVLSSADTCPGDNEGVVHQQASQAGQVKCNVDRAVFEADCKVGFSQVMRNDIGEFCAAGHGCRFGPTNAVVTEALSL